MTKPAQNLGDRFDRFPHGNERPTDHHHRQGEITCRFDLGRGGVSAGIPGDDNVSVEILQHGPITCAVERPTRHDHFCIGERQRLARRIDQPNQVSVLRIRRESLQMLPADAEEHTALRATKGLRRGRDIIDFDPVVARQMLPRRTLQRQQRHGGDLAGGDRIRAHLRREGMGRIDDAVDALCTKVVHKAGNTAKAADTPGNSRWQRIPGAAGIGQHRIDLPVVGQSCRQPVRVGSAAEDQNAQPLRSRGCHDCEQ